MFDIRGFVPFRGFGDFELDPFAFLQGPITFTDYIRIVHEHIATAVFLLNKPKAFFTIEPLHLSVGWH